MIREHGTKDVFYVIDINYFPGKYNLIPFLQVPQFLIVLVHKLGSVLFLILSIASFVSVLEIVSQEDN